MLLVLTAVFQALLLLTDASGRGSGDGETGDSRVLGAPETVRRVLGSGAVKGRLIRLPNGQTVEGYLGLPYAEPPIGELRFQAPVPKRAWGLDHVFDATEFGPLCHQDRQRQTWDLAFDQTGRRYMKKISLKKYRQSEDCLTLNLYTYRNSAIYNSSSVEPTRNSEQFEDLSFPDSSEGYDGDPLRPVMVYFHGGSYQMSGGRFYPGEWLTWMGEVVVVTLNYRLGPFGFLSTGDKVVPGNAGLMDQLAALEWIRSNIRSFGGHPGRVTIFGNSAGGACVGLHMMSPLSNGLFTTAIGQSGSAVARWAVQRHPKRQAQRLARDLGCVRIDSSQAILSCLRTQSAEMIVKKAGIPTAMSIRFAPVIDHQFLPGDPETLIRKGKTHPVPFMTGLTRDEVTIWMSHYSNPGSIRLTKQKVKKYVQYLLSDNSTTESNLEALVHAVYTEYAKKRNADGNSTNGANRPAEAITLAELLSDVGLKAPGIHLAKLMSRQSTQPVYLYEFEYSSQDDLTIMNNSWVGAYHESELHYVFGVPFLDLKNAFRLAEDKQVSRTIIKLWTDFAKSGNPTPDPVNFTWQQYSPGNHKYATLGLNPEMKRVYRERRMTFWNSFVPLFTDYGMEVHKKVSLVSPREMETLMGLIIALGVLILICLLLLGLVVCGKRRKKAGLSMQARPTLV